MTTSTQQTTQVFYEITNGYHIKDDLKRKGGTFNHARASWLITEEAFEELDARSGSWGAKWIKGWSAAKKTKFAAYAGIINFANPIN